MENVNLELRILTQRSDLSILYKTLETSERQDTSLVAQWLRLQAPNAGGLDSIPGQGTRSHEPQLKVPHAVT